MTTGLHYYIKALSDRLSSKPGECRYCGGSIEDASACPACMEDMLGANNTKGVQYGSKDDD